MTAARAEQPRRLDDRGSVSFFTIGILLAAFFLMALIVDGSRIRAERRHAGDIAHQAARTAAQEIDEASRLNGDLLVAPDSAAAAAQAVIGAAGADGTATVEGGSVTVEVVLPVELIFLSALGDRTVRAVQVVETTEAF